MIGLLAGFVGRLSGPVLVYVLLGLMATNAATGWLLKNAWTKNAQAVLVCENQALRDANAAKEAVARELIQIRDELAESEKQKKIQTDLAEKEITDALRKKEIEHEQALANMEAATNEIPDDDFFCASEPVSFDLLTGLRNSVAAYNKARNNPSDNEGAN